MEKLIVKQGFMDAFKGAVKGTPYSSPKDSTSAITIKVIDKKQKKVFHSCDFAISSDITPILSGKNIEKFFITFSSLKWTILPAM